MKRKNMTRLFTALLIVSLIFSVLPMAVSAQETKLITTRAEFEKALRDAKDGDTLLVGDIDFELPYTGAVNTVERITIDKSVTVKNGKTDGNAVFWGASFILSGTKIGGDRSSFVFEGIIFDEINIGGMGVSGKRTKFFRNISASEEEKQMMKEMVEAGSKIHVRIIAEDSATDISKMI